MSGGDFSRWESYFYPGTDVLINKLGIRDPERLKQFEHAAAMQRTVELRAVGVTGFGDLAHLQAVHRHLFQDTYEWAGQVRDVSMAKGTSASFVKPEDIAAEAAEIHARLEAADRFIGMGKVAFVRNLSTCFADLNRLHPFREGNGRATRVVLGHIAERAGYVLDQTRIDNDKGQWNAAAAKSMSGDISDVQVILNQAIRPSRAVALERLPREEVLARHPELGTVYALLDSVATQLEALHSGNAKAQAHFLAQRRGEFVRQLDGGDTGLLGRAASVNCLVGAPDSAWHKAQEFATTKIKDPKVRRKFLAQFQERMRTVEPRASRPEREIMR